MAFSIQSVHYSGFAPPSKHISLWLCGRVALYLQFNVQSGKGVLLPATSSKQSCPAYGDEKSQDAVKCCSYWRKLLKNKSLLLWAISLLFDSAHGLIKPSSTNNRDATLLLLSWILSSPAQPPYLIYGCYKQEDGDRGHPPRSAVPTSTNPNNRRLFLLAI